MCWDRAFDSNDSNLILKIILVVVFLLFIMKSVMKKKLYQNQKTRKVNDVEFTFYDVRLKAMGNEWQMYEMFRNIINAFTTNATSQIQIQIQIQ